MGRLAGEQVERWEGWVVGRLAGAEVQGSGRWWWGEGRGELGVSGGG